MVRDKGKGRIDPLEEQRLEEARRIEEQRLHAQEAEIPDDVIANYLRQNFGDEYARWGLDPQNEGRNSSSPFSFSLGNMDSSGNPRETHLEDNNEEVEESSEEEEEEEREDEWRQPSEGSNNLRGGGPSHGSSERSDHRQGAGHSQEFEPNIPVPPLRLHRGRRQRAASGFVVRIRSKLNFLKYSLSF